MLRFLPSAQFLVALLLSLAAEFSYGQTLEASLVAGDHNGYHITCFGAKDGSLTVTPAGGNPPYSFLWSTGATTASISGLPAGYYKVQVSDTDTKVDVDITLTEPLELKLTAEPFKYPSGKHISCHSCYNGSIDVTVEDGVAPYTYGWNDGVTTQDRSGLGGGTYDVKVTDANGCSASSSNMYLEEPERNDWTMDGNANTNPATQYIGTSDNKDVVFKANAQEAIRLKANGDIVFDGNLDGEGPLYRREDGVLGAGFPTYPEIQPDRCRLLRSFPYWQTKGNAFDQLCPEEIPKLGTLVALPLRIITDDVQRMFISETGKVGMGTEPPTGPVGDYRLFVEGGVVCRDVLVKLGDWPDYVFEPGYKRMPLSELREYIGLHKHLPGIPSAREVEANDGVELGDLQKRMLKVMEEQALYILQLEKGQGELELRIQRLESMDR